MGARVIRPGIAVIAQPMPGHPLASSNCYLIATDTGAIVIDPGYERPQTLTRIAHGLQAIGHGLDDVEIVLLTHNHRDHAEAAGSLRARTGAAVALHPADGATSATGRTVPLLESRVLESWGVPAPVRERLLARRLPHAVHADIDLVPGREWFTTSGPLRVLHTPGHTAGSVCLVLPSERIIFTGDHVLPDLNPGAGVGGSFTGNPLRSYLDSLRAMRAYEGYLAHPGHGAPMAAVHERARQIAEHHRARTREIAHVIAAHPDATVWELAEKVRWSGGFSSLDDGRRISALRQTFWHRQIVEESAAAV